MAACVQAGIEDTGTKKQLSTRLVEYHNEIDSSSIHQNESDSEGDDGFDLFNEMM